MNVNNITDNASLNQIQDSSTNLQTDNKAGKTFEQHLTGSITYKDLFNKASATYNVDVSLLEAVAMTESDFNPNCVSSAGAMGIMQIMPKTAEYLGISNAFDPVENVFGGAKYLRELLDKYNNNTDLALAAYNGGMGNVKKYNGVPPFCERYVQKVHNYLNQHVHAPDTVISTSSAEKYYSAKPEFNSNNGIHKVYSDGPYMTALDQYQLLKSMLNDSDEYARAISLIDIRANYKPEENDKDREA